MAKPSTLAEAFDQKFSRQKKMLPKKEKMHPAAKFAMDSFAKLHGMKFSANAGRFGKKKK